jgi:lipoprotein-anchoring transpeptidase ErfK/SrfK
MRVSKYNVRSHAIAIASLVAAASALVTANAAHAVPDPQSGAGNTVFAAPNETTTAPVKPAAPRPPVVTLTADINLTTQQMTVTAGGKVQHVWPISSGRTGFETPTGSFRPQWAAKMHFSKTYDLAPMPHAVFFNGGIATHATSATGMLGRPASHGCIRLSPAAAATFYALVHKNGYAATRIVVHGAPKVKPDAVASRRDRDSNRSVALRPIPRTYAAYPYPPMVNRYGYATTSGYGAPPQLYVIQRPIPRPYYFQQRYVPPGYIAPAYTQQRYTRY